MNGAQDNIDCVVNPGTNSTHQGIVGVSFYAKSWESSASSLEV